jgi:hypothetical protein
MRKLILIIPGLVLVLTTMLALLTQTHKRINLNAPQHEVSAQALVPAM